MTEEEWLSSSYPVLMLEGLPRSVSDRKLRLIASACCRQPAVWRLLGPKARALVEIASRLADDEASAQEIFEVAQAVPPPGLAGGFGNRLHLPPLSQAGRTALALAVEDASEALWAVVREGVNLLGTAPCHLMREILGNPFQPAQVDSAWLTWNSGIVLSIAQAIYDACQFAALPILGDALYEAGCGDQQILSHCRNVGDHVRGCWVIDLLLQKR